MPPSAPVPLRLPAQVGLLLPMVAPLRLVRQARPPRAHAHVHVHVHMDMRVCMCMCMYWAMAHTRVLIHSARCGRPLGPAEGEVVFTRAFEGCRVSLDCTNATKCVGNISFSDEPERAVA